MEVPPKSPPSSVSHELFHSVVVDAKIRLILLSSPHADVKGLEAQLNDPSRHRSSIVRCEKLLAYVCVDKSLIQESQTNIDSIVVDVVLHERRAPASTGKYYPSNGNLPIVAVDSNSMPPPILLPDGSVCFIKEITVGDGVYDKVQAFVQFSPSTLADEMSRLDLDDLGVFKSSSPGFNFLKSLSRREEPLQGTNGNRASPALKVDTVEPVHVGWDRQVLDSTILWSICVRNRVRDEDVTIHRIQLLFSNPKESLRCLNRDHLPKTLQPDDVYCFVFSVSNSCTSIPTASLTLHSAYFSAPIMYQVQLIVADRADFPVSLHLQCPSEVSSQTTFAVAVTLCNSGPEIRDIKVGFESSHSEEQSAVKSFLSLDKTVGIDSLPTGQTKTVKLHFLALREGLIRLSNISVCSSTRNFCQDRALFVLVTRASSTK